MTRASLIRLPALVGVAALTACATAPDVAVPAVELPARYASSGDAPASPIASTWWTAFGDAALDRLVDAALAHNLDLRLAVARVDETASVLGLARAAQWPGVDLGAAVTRARVSGLNGQALPATGAESTTHRLALSTSFEIDLWGRLRHATAAAQAQLLAAQHARDTVRLAVAGGTAQLYFGLRALDAQIAVVDSQLIARRDSLQVVERRLAAGA